MPNPIKYNTSSESLALKKGNFWIGTGDVGKGPTSSTGFYNGITPPSGGYTIYLNKGSGGPSIRVANNNTELITITNQIAGASYTTINECFNYFAGQSDKMVVQRDYEGIVTNGLILNYDAGFLPSYPQNSTTLYDVGGTTNATLNNGVGFNSGNGGSLSFDGSDDYVGVSFTNPYSETIIAWAKSNTSDWNNYGWISSARVQNGHIIHPEVGTKQISYYVLDSGSQYTNIGGATLADITVPRMYSMSTNGSNLHKCYLNGDLISTSTTSVGRTQSPTSQSWDIGRDNCCGGGRAGNGLVYIVLRYNRQLTDSEILQNYNAQKGRFGL